MSVQYYYKRVGCPAKNHDDIDCICWHDEGTGAFKDEKHTDQHSGIKLNWRLKPVIRK